MFKRNQEILAAFVDDCMVGTVSKESYSQIVHNISKHLKIVDQGQINHFLKIKVEYNLNERVCKLSQPVFVDKIIQFCGLSMCKGKSTPLDPHVQLRKSEECLNDRPYREVIGQLLYLATCTRPDVYHAVMLLSQFSNNYSHEHWDQLLHVVKYLSTTRNEGIFLRPGDFTMKTYTDSDWGGNLDSRRSTSGIVIMLGSGLVFWKSKIQKTVAHSTMEAEFKALATAVSFALWVKDFINELVSNHLKKIDFYCDNQGCILALQGRNYKGRSKHNEIHFNIVKERIERNCIKIHYIESDFNVSDMFTKSIVKNKLQFLKQRIRNSSLGGMLYI